MSILNSLQVIPGYQLSGDSEPITATKFNLAAKPQVNLVLNQQILDENYLRNGNFYGSFWATPSGVNSPAGSQTLNASYWYCQPAGSGNVNYLQSTTTPDLLSLYSAKLVGATGISDVLFLQQITPDLSATLRQVCTFSVWIYNGTSSPFVPTFQIATANASNNFATVTVQADLNLQSCAAGIWTYCTVIQDLSVYTNDTNGFQFAVHIPAGVLNAGANSVNICRPKLQPGSMATPYADDLSLFVNITSVGTANLQNGCVTTPKIATGAVTYSLLDTVTVDPFLCQTGSIVLWTTGTAPTGWLLCQGQAVSRTTYSALYAVVGTTYGAGDGSTTFNLPNLQGNVPMGSSGSYALATTGGEVNHTLVTGELPVHTHGVTDPGHNHTQNAHNHGITDPGHSHFDATYGTYGGSTVNIYQSGSGNSAFTASNTTGISVNNATPTNNASGTGISINNAGSGSAHNNLQPYLVLNYIIKI